MACQRQTGARAPLTRQGVRDLGDDRGAHHPRLRQVRVAAYPVAGDGRPRVAVDVQVSARSIEAMERTGFCVAVVAEHGELDQLWFARAVAARCDLVVTPDYEVQEWGRAARMVVVPLHDAAGRIRSDAEVLVNALWNKTG